MSKQLIIYTLFQRIGVGVAAVAAENRAHKCRSIPYPGKCIVICTKCASHHVIYHCSADLSPAPAQRFIWHLLSIYSICTILRQTQYNITPSHAFSSCLRTKAQHKHSYNCLLDTHEWETETGLRQKQSKYKLVRLFRRLSNRSFNWVWRAQTMGLRPCAHIWAKASPKRSWENKFANGSTRTFLLPTFRNEIMPSDNNLGLQTGLLMFQPDSAKWFPWVE